MDELILYQLKDEIYRLDPSVIGGKVRFNGITLDYTNYISPNKRGGWADGRLEETAQR